MITFGYNSRFSSILRSLAAVAIGLLMIFSSDATLKVVQIISAFLFAAGLVTFVYGYINRKSGAMTLMTVNAIVDIVIGILLYFFAPAISGIIVFLVAIAILIFGILQLIVLAGTMSLIGNSPFSLLLSILAIVGGIILLFNPFSEMVMRILAGCCLVVYGTSEIFSMVRVARARKEYEIRFEQKPEEDNENDTTSGGDSYLENVKDAEFHKADEQ